MKNLQGVYTALITPFTKGGNVDEDALGRIVEFQIERGITVLFRAVPRGRVQPSPTKSTTGLLS